MFVWFAYPTRQWNEAQQSNGYRNSGLSRNIEKFRGKFKVHSVYTTRHPQHVVITEDYVQLPGTS